MNPIKKIVGERVYLRPITLDDTDMVLKWRNSEYVVNNFFYRVPVSYEEHVRWVTEKVQKGLVHQFIVCMNADDTPVGCVYLQHFDKDTNSMESGVFMSENAPKGKGIGTEAVKLLNYDYAFKELNLDFTIARVIAENIGSLKLHEKAGFVETKRQKDLIIPTNEEVDSVEFKLINDSKRK